MDAWSRWMKEFDEDTPAVWLLTSRSLEEYSLGTAWMGEHNIPGSRASPKDSEY
jgi:hypothetical protein